MKLSEKELLAHNWFVQRLALQLVKGDQDAATDITQEVMLRALLSPPSSTSKGLRPWLRVVLRNVFRRRRRAANLRKAKEHLGFRYKPPPDPAKILETEQVRHDVVRAVTSLPAEQREVILLRFYNDYPPSQIAAFLEVPVETVKTRQKRGLATLRQRLDKRYGSGENWIVMIVPLAVANRYGPLRKNRTSATTMWVGATVVFAALLTLTVSMSQWRADAPESTAREDGSVASSLLSGQPAFGVARRVETHREQSRGMVSARRRSRNVRSPALRDKGAAAKGATTTLRYAVRSEDGSWIDDASLRLINGSGRTLSSRREAGSRPAYVFSAVPPGSWRLECAAPAHFLCVTDVALDGRNSERHEEILLERAHLVPVRLVTPSGQLLAEARKQAPLGASAVSVRWLDPRYYSILASDAEEIDLRPTARSTYHRVKVSRFIWNPGTGRHSAQLELRSRNGIYLHLVFRHIVLETKWWKEVPSDGLEFVVRPDQVRAHLSELTVRVVDGVASAPPPCMVMTRELGTTLGSLGVETEADGIAVFDHQVPGFVILEVRPAAGDPRVPRWTLSRLLHVPTGVKAEPLELTVWKPLVVPAVFRDVHGKAVRVHVRRANLDEGYPFPLDMLSEAGWIAPDGRYEVVLPERGRRLLILATAIEEGNLAASPQLVDTSHLPELLEFEFGPAGTLHVEFTQDYPTHFAEITNHEGLPVWASEVQGPSQVQISLLAEQDYTLATFERTRDGELSRIEETSFHLGTEKLRFVQ